MQKDRGLPNTTNSSGSDPGGNTSNSDPNVIPTPEVTVMYMYPSRERDNSKYIGYVANDNFDEQECRTKFILQLIIVIACLMSLKHTNKQSHPMILQNGRLQWIF